MPQSTLKERIARVEVQIDTLNGRIENLDGKMEEVLKILKNGMNIRLVKLEEFMENYNEKQKDRKDWWKWAVRGATLTVYGYFIKIVIENLFK